MYYKADFSDLIITYCSLDVLKFYRIHLQILLLHLLKIVFKYVFITKKVSITTNADFTTLIIGGYPVLTTTDTDKYFVFGDPLTCSIALKDTPAVSEDAEELSFKETCTKDQYEEVVKDNKIEYCPNMYCITSKNMSHNSLKV